MDKLLLVGLVLVAAVCGTEALQCYSCSNLLSGDTCGESAFDPESAQIKGNCSYCMKSVAAALGISTVGRDCVDHCTADHTTGAFGTKAITACCQEDLCNSAPTVTVRASTATASALTLLAALWLM